MLYFLKYATKLSVPKTYTHESFIRSKNHFGNHNKLVVCVFALEHGFFFENLKVIQSTTNYAGKKTSKAPHVQTVVILTKVNQQFGAFEVARSDADVEICAGLVKVGQTPIDKTQLVVEIRKWARVKTFLLA